VVDVRAPDGYRVVPTAGSVCSVVPVRHHGLLLLATPWSISALGGRETTWTTRRIAVEGLRLDEIDEGWLRGVADPEDDEPRDFAVELSSGRVVGGAGRW
jgi:hypothetical protein